MTLSPFGQKVRHFRARSGMSQLDLAAAAGTTTRHVLIPRDRTLAPGQELVLRLATAPDVPIRERNALLLRAGLPPAYPDHQLSDQAMRSINLVLDRALHVHEPYPAWVGPRPDVPPLESCRRVFVSACVPCRQNRSSICGMAGPFRDLVENWQDVVFVGVAHLRREATHFPSCSIWLDVRVASKEHSPPLMDAALRICRWSVRA